MVPVLPASDLLCLVHSDWRVGTGLRAGICSFRAGHLAELHACLDNSVRIVGVRTGQSGALLLAEATIERLCGGAALVAGVLSYGLHFMFVQIPLDYQQSFMLRTVLAPAHFAFTRGDLRLSQQHVLVCAKGIDAIKNENLRINLNKINTEAPPVPRNLTAARFWIWDKVGEGVTETVPALVVRTINDKDGTTSFTVDTVQFSAYSDMLRRNYMIVISLAHIFWFSLAALVSHAHWRRQRAAGQSSKPTPQAEVIADGDEFIYTGWVNP